MESHASRGGPFLTSWVMEPPPNPNADDRTIDPAQGVTSAPTTAATKGPTPTRRGIRARADAFAPGSVVADRYRIISLLGKGGMGEVYRADDLTLGVSVALKFLPAHLSSDPVWLARLRDEVRTARQISHPNVCRVHDIGEQDDRVFLSMEYVDGEDLASLLRRIGRLPFDKAVQVARQICMGLAAAHDAGVIHRDMKPGNVMLDGRGNARITDFGIATTAGDAAAGVAGTPAYMAPEQARGEVPTRASDIYALGLVLYELFTGRAAQNAQSVAEVKTLHETLTGGSTTVMSPSSVVAEVDPTTERAILRCLEPQAANRPPSALAVAAALPGGDPLAAAIAAGETPSPEMVALAGGASELRPRTAGVLVGVLCAMLMIFAWLRSSQSIVSIARPPFSPPVLVAKAKEHLAVLGVESGYDHQAYGFFVEEPFLTWKRKNEALVPLGERETLRRALLFWYREQNADLVPLSWWRAAVSRDDPPSNLPLSVDMSLDCRGKLIRFTHMPAESGWRPPMAEGAAQASAAAPFDWAPAFTAAGLTIGSFATATPERLNTAPADQRFAWTGVMPEMPEVAVRVEAGLYQGRPVEFRVFAPWRVPDDAVSAVDSVIQKGLQIFGLLAILSGLIGAALLARMNIRSGRADAVGARRLAIVIFFGELVRMAIARHTIADVFSGDVIGRCGARSVWIAMLVWLLYIAIEPFVRRYWPESLIAWARLLAGKWKDARVSRDVLIAAVLGAVAATFIQCEPLVVAALTKKPVSPAEADMAPLLGTGFFISATWNLLNGSVTLVLLFTLLFVGLRQMISRPVVYHVVGTLLIALLINVQGNSLVSEIVLRLLIGISTAWMVVRLGILAACAGSFVMTLLLVMPQTIHAGEWNAPPGLLTLSLVFILALACAWRASMASRLATT